MRGSLMTRLSDLANCASRKVRTSAWTFASRHTFAVLAHAAGRASETWTLTMSSRRV